MTKEKEKSYGYSITRGPLRVVSMKAEKRLRETHGGGGGTGNPGDKKKALRETRYFKRAGSEREKFGAEF